MLSSLYIQNYALIERLDITFEDGFSVITGETGAGKSIMLGAIGLLLGQRADSKAIRQGAGKCVIEAHFDIKGTPTALFLHEQGLDDGDECILRREVLASGKSRAFINDTPVQLNVMKELGESLIDIHSQHQNLLLNNEGFQLYVLDILAYDMPLLTDYKGCYQAWKRAQTELQRLREEAERNKADEDYVRFQLTQLQEAHLQADEQETLEQEAEMLDHAEDIKTALYESSQLLDGDERSLLMALKDCQSSLQGISKVFPVAQELADRLDSSYIELKDIADEISAREESVEFNPARLEEVTERLNTLYTLQKKHHVDSVAALMEIEADYQHRLDNITSSDDQIVEMERNCEALRQKLIEMGKKLTKAREKAAKAVEERMIFSLQRLGMPNVRFQVVVSSKEEPGQKGLDSVSYLFSANKSGALQDISSVASGGEIARVMLSLKEMLAGEARFNTIIFDEIDTGVSGEIASRMASMMENMAAGSDSETQLQGGRQVISITHLPQIAARGKVHYKVYKKDNEHETVSHIKRLTDEERIEEIAKMLSGDSVTEAALQNAKELLKGVGCN
ncbi:MAG: DNA repair protein RecN [Bacteroidaceae bacterium]|nr:DNA repair protein RecN [Bacteroidaceae bacterium]